MGYYEDEQERWRRPDSYPFASKSHTSSTVNSPAVRGIVEPSLPEEMNVLPSGRQRAGFEQRQQTAERLGQAYGDGFLTESEHTARYDYVMNTAKTDRELTEIVRDLPAPRDKRTTRQKVRDDFTMRKARWYVPVHMVSAFLCLLLAILPSAIAAQDNWWTTPHGLALVIPAMILGAAGFVVNVCMAIHRAVDGK